MLITALSCLLVEGDEAHAQAMVRGLASALPGCETVHAATLGAARDQLAAAPFDVVVIALSLPDGSVFELLEELCGHPVLLCVAETEEAQAARALRRGLEGYLVKDAAFEYVRVLGEQVLAVIRQADRQRHLRESEEFLDRTGRMANIGGWVMDLRTSLPRWTAQTRRIHEVADDFELNEASSLAFYGPEAREVITQAVRAGIKHDAPWHLELPLTTARGRPIWVEIQGQAEREGGKAIRLWGTMQDITERKHAQQAAARQHRLLQAIGRAQALFIESTGKKAAFERVLADLLELTDSAYGFVGEVLYGADGKPYLKTNAITNIAWDEPTRRLYDEYAAEGMEFTNLKTLFGAAMTSGTPVIANQPLKDPRRGGLPAGHPGMSAFLGIPISSGTLLVAMVGLANRPGGYSEDDVRFLEPLLTTLGRLVEAQRVLQERQHAQEQLEHATELLAQKSAALQATLGSMSQGIFKLDADARISVYNQRVLELLDLPEALMGTRPTLAELTRVQAERGDFGDGYGLIDGLGRAYVAQGAVAAAPDIYWRRTRAGATIEVRTKNLAEGGLVRTFADVTDYFGMQQELRESEARLRSLTELSSDWLWEQDAEFRFVRFDGDWRSSGIAPEQSLGATRWDIGALNMSNADWSAHRATLNAHQVFKDLEIKRERADGSVHWISVSGAPIFDSRGQFCGYRGVGKDITDRKQVEGKVERLAFYDLLTGLPNRRLLIDRLQQALAASGRSGSLGALLFIDLDNFKDLNDTLGHDMGDRLLEQVAQRLVTCIRECDTVARFGGDEFVVMVENLSGTDGEAAAQAEKVAEKLLAIMNQPFELRAQLHYSTPSIGITLFGRQDQTIDELLKHADLAMYQAKAAGRNTLCFFDPDMQAAVSARSALEADLRQGLQRQELLLY
ncbi:MAG TPA: diguanylate cyclase, partial [Burkholderiaceae bacterium]|nr:diguanylate cyclase [Burkholderiaceae bacterium]